MIKGSRRLTADRAKRVSILLRYSMGRYCSSVVRTSISTHGYWYWEARYMCTAHVYTYVQVLPVCTGQSVLYRPLYGLIARRLLSGQSEGQVIWELSEEPGFETRR